MDLDMATPFVSRLQEKPCAPEKSRLLDPIDDPLAATGFDGHIVGLVETKVFILQPDLVLSTLNLEVHQRSIATCILPVDIDSRGGF